MACVDGSVLPLPRIIGPDPSMMPFDGKRMIYGGFETLVRLQQR